MLDAKLWLKPVAIEDKLEEEEETVVVVDVTVEEEAATPCRLLYKVELPSIVGSSPTQPHTAEQHRSLQLQIITVK